MTQPTIYALIDPRDNQVRYIGRTIQPLAWREREHYSHAPRHADGCPRDAWIATLRLFGLRPTIKALEVVTLEDMNQAEKRWVAHYRARGQLLFNSATPGGGGTRSHVIKWTPALDARLGKESDSVIAKELGVERNSVSYRRAKLGIPSNAPRGSHVSGTSRNRSSVIVWPPELEARLGKVADAIIAEELGVHRKTVAYWRGKLGIPAAFDRSRNKPPPTGPPWNKRAFPQHVLDRLGTLPDYILAAELGIQKSIIARRRRALGIPSYAAQTGNSGQYKPGNIPARWNKEK